MADERRHQGVEMTPEEERFLHRLIRRAALPWIAFVGALAGLALGVALSQQPPPAQVVAEPGGTDAPAAQDELRAEIAGLREELAALRAQAAPRPASVSRERVAVPTAASSDEFASFRDRLYNLETRQDRKEQENAALRHDLLARLFQLEQSVQSEAAARIANLETSEQRIGRVELRLSGLEGLPAQPASPAPSTAPR